ncbi:MAG: hypothetical protein Q7R76_05750 [Candidatus Woesearchaeota archaeon]|nr:hypothetical protein [Candidatus Woesearchaeota archaeon]
MARNTGKAESSTASDVNTLLLHDLFSHFLKLMKDQGMSYGQLSQLYNAEETSVPVEIFAKKLSPSEAVCKFLKENRNKSFHEIAVLLQRDDRSVWTSYTRAVHKQKSLFIISQPSPTIPLSVLANRQFSFLESVILHLAQTMKPMAIARLLHRSAPIIYTVLSRARQKKEDT